MKKFLALNASAGSGKTFAISTRFIALILSGANICEITALTFTKKAANEMKERIVNSFLDLHKDSKKSEKETVARLLEISADEVIQRRDKLYHSFLQEDLKISTFDAFFGGILRQFSLNIGLSSDFSISNALQHKQYSKFISKIIQKPTLLKALAKLIVQAENSQDNLFNNLNMLFENFSNIGAGAKIETKTLSDKKVFEILGEMRDFVINKGGSKQAINSFSKNDIFELISSSFLQKDSLNYQTYSKVYDPTLDDLFYKLKLALKQYFDELEAYKLNELNSFLQIYKNTRLELNVQLNTLSFSDVTSLVYELLCVKQPPINMLYFRLDGRINHLLIDEFQDTNVRQYEIIKPIISEIVAGDGQNGIGSFFYVGDIKQSIYRFRGGKKELFGKLKSDFKQIKSENLEFNYRSHKALVKFVNTIFSNKIENFIPQIPKKSGEEFDYDVSGNCEYFDTNSDDYGYLSVVSSDNIASMAVTQVKKLIQNGVNTDDITILCWKNDDINKLTNLLENEGIDSLGEGSLDLIKSPFVRAVIEYAKFCLFGDEIYKLNVMTILDIKELEVLKIEPNLNASVALNILAKRLHISNNDIILLIEKANKYTTLSEFIFNLDSFDEKAGAKSKNGVNIMTVFKSKGLEFKHVIVCDKIGKGKGNSSNFLIEYDVKNGWSIRHKAKKENFDESYKELSECSKILDKQEDMNKIYVAFTRAINSLIIVRNGNPDGNNPSFFTTYNLSNGDVVEYLDLKDFSFGKIIPSKILKIVQNSDDSIIEIPNIARQELVEIDLRQDENFSAIYFGLALHFLLEMAQSFSFEAIKIASIAMRNKFYKFLLENELNDVENRALMLISDDKFKRLIEGKQIFKEQPLMFNNSLKQIDLLCVGDDEICIIDYKTSQSNIDENKLQVALYKEAICKIYDRKRTKAFLVYVLKKEISIIEV